MAIMDTGLHLEQHYLLVPVCLLSVPTYTLRSTYTCAYTGICSPSLHDEKNGINYATHSSPLPVVVRASNLQGALPRPATALRRSWFILTALSRNERSIVLILKEGPLGYLSLFWHVIFVIRLIVQQIHKYTNTSLLDHFDEEEQTRDHKRKMKRR